MGVTDWRICAQGRDDWKMVVKEAKVLQGLYSIRLESSGTQKERSREDHGTRSRGQLKTAMHGSSSWMPYTPQGVKEFDGTRIALCFTLGKQLLKTTQQSFGSRWLHSSVQCTLIIFININGTEHYQFLPQDTLSTNISIQTFYSIHRKKRGKDDLRTGTFETGRSTTAKLLLAALCLRRK